MVNTMSQQRGFVLPMTMIVIALLAVLSMGLSQQARFYIKNAEVGKDLLSQELLMKSNVQWVLYHLLVGVIDKGELKVDGLVFPLNGSVIKRDDMDIYIQDSAGLLGLSFYQEDVFERLLKQLTDEDSAKTLAARLGDWVDHDNISRYKGMEVSDYIRLGLTIRPRNGAIRSLDELLKLPGMTNELFNGSKDKFGLRDLLLAGGEGHFNLSAAPDILVGPVLGISGRRLKKVLELRAQKKWDVLYEFIKGNRAFYNDAYSPYSAGSQYQIKIYGKKREGIRVMYALQPFSRVPYHLMLWQYPDFHRG